MSIRIGVIGCGSVFWTPYMSVIERLRGQAAWTSPRSTTGPREEPAGRRPLDLTPDLPDDLTVCSHPEVDVEKPVATTLEEAEQVLAVAEAVPGHLVFAPHILLSPTYRALHARVLAGEIGGLLTPRGRYGGAGPDPSGWVYEPGGGALFDLGVYNVTSRCGFFGPARRVTATTGVAIPERTIDGERVRVRAEDNAHVLIDFGDARTRASTW
jgi:hypothetical protein